MMTITVRKDAHGIKLSTRRATRYVSRGLVGTLCETASLREVISNGNTVAARYSTARAPGDWPESYGEFEARIERHAR
jgi:hypothetical protein